MSLRRFDALLLPRAGLPRCGGRNFVLAQAVPGCWHRLKPAHAEKKNDDDLAKRNRVTVGDEPG